MANTEEWTERQPGVFYKAYGERHGMVIGPTRKGDWVWILFDRDGENSLYHEHGIANMTRAMDAMDKFVVRYHQEWLAGVR